VSIGTLLYLPTLLTPVGERVPIRGHLAPGCQTPTLLPNGWIQILAKSEDYCYAVPTPVVATQCTELTEGRDAADCAMDGDRCGALDISAFGYNRDECGSSTAVGISSKLS